MGAAMSWRGILIGLMLLVSAGQADAASRFWVGGTGTWDASDTTHWASSSGGAGGQSVPGSADSVTLDGSSGGGTVTVNTTITISSLAMGAFTGTLDFSANNNNITITSASAFSGTGAGTRTLNMGNGTWTLSSAPGVGVIATQWNMTTTTGLTFNANSSEIIFSGNAAGTSTFVGGGLTYNKVTLNTAALMGDLSMSGANTIATFAVGAGRGVIFPSSTTTTITNAFAQTGTAAVPVTFKSSSTSSQATVSTATGTASCAWCVFKMMVFSGGATFTAVNSLDLGGNSGITITPPSVGRIIGGWLLRRDLPANDNLPLWLQEAA